MRFDLILVVGRVRLFQVPVPLLVVLPEGIAQAAVVAGGLAKFHGELSEQVLLLQVTAGLGNLTAQHFGECEVLQQSDEVRKGFVKCQRVRMGSVDVAAMHAVQNGVRCFVGDDVVAETGKHRLAGQLQFWSGRF